MSSIPTLQTKQGESFRVELAYCEEDKITPRSLEGYTLSSQIRDSNDNEVANLTVNLIDPYRGRVALSADAGTATWPVGTLYWDIREEVGGVVSLTSTSTIIVDKAITRL
jgi:hypothetical protein